ncbi:MAG TPA: aldo/keto reductase [Candidatus Binatia bacterium]|nr:aldo/keto reductase [Candidatus Binatia bacterium]
MELKPLGNTGVVVPEIGLGVWRYSGGMEPLRQGIALGAYLLDTAEIYGTEDVVGRAVNGIRERVFIATKVSGDHLRYDRGKGIASDLLPTSLVTPILPAVT